ncbi:ABC transporter substrate-binding protein [Roseateles oligotrophus]|uniref:Substrate-binding domain-containing protein n=1 Tax=Roseateles oligotrophus TaxID=1769250 RepID=A0ABT2Y990_9BURK|nr:substrate-binding domain-containing protein [Roseateles oligotrophus]MCV2366853.1 substrate-binding domain-containing protein [Roseateles oligotrophus]
MGFVVKTVCGFLLAIGLSVSGHAQERAIVMASTTSTEQSGLFAHLLPAFKQVSGIEVRVVALGTGQALDMGRRGDADVLFVHDQAAEEKFVAEGYGLARRAVMFNDFVLVGPASDPADVRGQDIVAALKKLATAKAPFISRGDKSGTHAAELRFWKAAGIDDPAAKTDAQRLIDYRACGCGMGPALNIASSLDGYALTDRGTWLSFKNRGNLAVLVEGDKRLFNQYGVIVINPAKHPHTKTAQAQAFADWVVSPQGQASIAAYKIGGEQLFFPNAKN